MPSYSPAALTPAQLRQRAVELRQMASLNNAADTEASPAMLDRTRPGLPPPVLSPDELEAALSTLRSDSIRPVPLERRREEPVDSGLGQLVLKLHDKLEASQDKLEANQGKLEASQAEAAYLRHQLAASQAEAAAAAKVEEDAARARVAEEEAVCAALEPAHARIVDLEEELDCLRRKIAFDQAEAAEAARAQKEAARAKAAQDGAGEISRMHREADRLSSELASVQLDKRAAEHALEETAQTADELTEQVTRLNLQVERQAETHSRSLRRISELEAVAHGAVSAVMAGEESHASPGLDFEETAGQPGTQKAIAAALGPAHARMKELQDELDAANARAAAAEKELEIYMSDDEQASSMSGARLVDNRGAPEIGRLGNRGAPEIGRWTVERLKAEMYSATQRAEAAERERDQTKARAQQIADEANLRAKAAKRELDEARAQTRHAHDELDLWMSDGESTTVVSHSGDTELDDVWDARRNSELEASRAVSAALGERLEEVERLATADREAAANLVRQMAQLETAKNEAVRKAEADANEKVQECKTEAEKRIAAVVAMLGEKDRDPSPSTQQAPDPRVAQLQVKLDKANQRAEAAERERDDEIFGHNASDAAAQNAIAAALGPAHARIAQLQASLDEANTRAATAEKELELYMSDDESSGIESVPEAEAALAVMSKKMDKAERVALADREAAANLVRQLAKVEAEKIEAVRKAEAETNERVRACKAEAEKRISALVTMLGEKQKELDALKLRLEGNGDEGRRQTMEADELNYLREHPVKPAVRVLQT